MPIHFRCPSCFGLLSIARRKAGNEVGCPKCGDLVIVPKDDADDGVTEVVEVGAELVTTSTRAAEQKQPVKEHDAPVSRPSEPDLKAAESKPVRPVRTEAKSKPSSGAGKSDRDESPLFERSDFEQLLNPAAKKTAELPDPHSAGTAARGLTGTASAPIHAPETARAASLTRVEEGIFISRSSAIMLAIMVFLLLGLSFAAGFLVGS